MQISPLPGTVRRVAGQDGMLQVRMAPYAPRNPFHAVRLPWLAHLHRWGFRQGRPGTPSPLRGLARLVFYAGKYLALWKPRGVVQEAFDDGSRTASFDARNRMFSVFYFDSYRSGVEPTVRAIIDLLAPDDGVLFDIGSNWGFHTITLASRPGFSGHIHAFEPLPATFRDVQSMVQQLRLDDTVTCHNLAVGEASATGVMRVGSNSGTAHLTSGTGGKTVQIAALDDLDLPPPTLMKVDTEGHEEQVFRGAERTLRAHRPIIVFEHRLLMLESQQQQIGPLTYLESLGYRLFLPRFHASTDASAQSALQLTPCTAENRAEHHGFPDLLACHANELHRLNDARGVIQIDS